MTIRHRRWRPAKYLTLTAAAVAVIAVLPGGEDGAVAPVESVEPVATGAQAIIDASLAVAAAEPVDAASPDAAAADALTTATVTPQATAIPPDHARPETLGGDAPETRMAAVDPRDGITDRTADADPRSAAVASAVEAPPMSAPATETPQVHVGSSALNVRTGPSSSAGKLFVLRPGQPVTILERDGNWARIATEAGEGGWVYSRYLDDPAASADPPSTRTVAAIADPPAEAPAASAPPEADRSVRHARIGSAMPARAAPSRDAAPLFTLPSGARVEIAETQGRWLRVVTDSGVSGWVRYR